MLQKQKRVVDPILLETYHSLPCIICGKRPSDPSHIKTKGSGGHDLAYNIVPKCRIHHIEWGQIGWKRFFKKYPKFKDHLISIGWEVTKHKLYFHRS